MINVGSDQVLLRPHVLSNVRQLSSYINQDDKAVPRKASKIAGNLLAPPKASKAALTS